MVQEKQRLSRFWKTLTTPIRELLSAEAIETAAESGTAVLELVKTLQEQGKSLVILKPLIEHSQSLLGLLCAPELQLVGAGLPFVPIAITFLRFYREKTQQDPTFEDCVAVISQAAYLESFKEIRNLPEYKSKLANLDAASSSHELVVSLQKLEKFELDNKAAKQAFISFPTSELCKVFNQVLSTRLQASGLNQDEISVFTERVAYNSKLYFFEAIGGRDNFTNARLDLLYSSQTVELLKKHNSIERYLKEEIASKPNETVFNENFTFKDIYVPLKARRVDSNNKIDESEESFDLEAWVKNLILDRDLQRQVIFIQAGPGRGKSVFCRMFAEWVRQHLHPMWTPVLIRLRDIDKFQSSLEETLRSRIKTDFAQNNNWLTDDYTRFIFILDGFDELCIERSTNQTIKEFLKQVGGFQQDYVNKHRIIITGRAMALHSIDRLPHNLERVEINELDIDLQNQWFANWQKHFNTDKTREFQKFIQNEQCCPHQLQELAKEPLLLYMLTAMHRDNTLDVNEFGQATDTNAKILIYQQALEWILEKQRSDFRHPDLNYQLTKQNPEALKRILAEAALCVVQSGGENASMQMLKARTQQDDEARQLLEAAEKELGEEVLKSTLCTFYLRADSIGGFEFYHKSFSEFLYAERLKQSLEDWTESGKRGKSFQIEDKQLHEQIYDLLGYGNLTPEIVQYLMGLLSVSETFKPVQLFQRLENFYLRWCDREFINAPPQENLPQRKMLQMQGQNIATGLLEVDIFTGLNIMILLLELHRYAQKQDGLKNLIFFYPCGREDTENFDDKRLLNIIGYSHCLGDVAFASIVGSFLQGIALGGVDLHGAYLGDVDLSYANISHTSLYNTNFSSANLEGVNFVNTEFWQVNFFETNLSKANFSKACIQYGIYFDSTNLTNTDFSGAEVIGIDFSYSKLQGANFIGTNLQSSDFHRAKLSHANFTNTDLRYVDFTGADLSNANFSGANLTDIHWDQDTKWENVRGLETAINIPEALKQQLGLE